jgi:hypothetical protein
MLSGSRRDGAVRPVPADLHHRIAFTNYSSTNQLTFERAQQVLMDRSFQAGKSYNFALSGGR